MRVAIIPEMEQLPDTATVSIDIEGAILTFDEGAEHLLGHRSADVIGRPMAEVLIPEPLRRAHFDGMARFQRTREPFLIGRTAVLSALRADGSVFPVELTLRVTSDDPLVVEGTLRRIG